jgi:hypothetical protein
MASVFCVYGRTRRRGATRDGVGASAENVDDVTTTRGCWRVCAHSTLCAAVCVRVVCVCVVSRCGMCGCRGRIAVTELAAAQL